MPDLIPRSVPPWALLAVLGACNQPPTEPELTLIPSDPTTLDDLVVVAESGDPNRSDTVEYTYVWSLDGVVQPDLTLAEVPNTRTAKDQTWSVEVTASDGRAESVAGRAAVTIRNAAPTATVRVQPEAPGTADDLEAIVTTDDPDGDEVTLRYVWARNGGDTPNQDAVLPALQTARGQNWTVRVTPTDGAADGEPVSAQVSVVNSAPVIASITYDPVAPLDADDVRAVVDAVDPDGDPITYAWRWTVDGLAAGGPSATLDDRQADRGQIVRVYVEASDGQLSTGEIEGPAQEILNAPPRATDIAITPATVYTDTDATCAPSGWFDGDGDPPGYRYTWIVNSGTTPFTTSTLPSATFSKGDRLQCIAEPYDGYDAGPTLQSPEYVVRNRLPVLDSAALTTTSPTTRTALGVVTGPVSDRDGDTVTLRVDWEVNGSVVATSDTLDPALIEKLDSVRAIVTPNDGEADGLPVATQTVTVRNSPPLITDATFTPNPPSRAVDLTVSPTWSDPDGDPVTFTYAWFLNETPVSGAAGPTLSAARFDLDDRIYVRITPRDTETGTVFVTPTVTVQNAVPSITRARITPTVLRETVPARCVGDGWSDPDGDPAGYEYAWLVDDVPVPGAVSETLDGTWFDEGDEVKCVLTPFDGRDRGTPRTSTPVSVGNDAPVLTDLTLQPDVPTTADDLVATPVGLFDPDPLDTATIDWDWFIDDAPVPGVSGPTLASGAFARGDRVRVRATPTDGTFFGESLEVEVTIANSPPRLTDVVLSPASPTSADPITVSYTLVDDDPTDTPFVDIVWIVGGSEVPGVTGEVLPTGRFGRGQTVIAEVRPDDGDGPYAPVRSAAVVVANSPPSAPSVRVTPKAPQAGQDALFCEVVVPSTDFDGDPVDYTMTWTRDGAAAGGAVRAVWPGDTIPGTLTGDGEDWVCTATPLERRTGGVPGEAAVGATTTVDYAVRRPSAGDDYTCALDPDREVRCWGRTDQGEYDPPPTAQKMVVAGFDHTCALAVDGRLDCWGTDGPLLTGVPSGVYKDLDLGLFHACALRSNGQPECWGSDAFQESTPVELTYDQITVGYVHSCGRRLDGSVRCWGSADQGQYPPPPGQVFSDLAAGATFTCGVTQPDGVLSCWGEGDGIESVPAGTGWIDVEAGPAHACALRDDRTMQCWGDPSVVDLTVPTVAAGWAWVAPGSTHTCALSLDGALHCWGADDVGQLAQPIRPYTALAAGWNHTCGLLAGEVTCWGDDTYGQSTPPDTLLEPVGAIALGEAHTCAIEGDGTLACWGQNDEAQRAAPAGPHDLLVAGRDHTCALDPVGGIACWGDTPSGAPDPDGLIADVPTDDGHLDLALGNRHTCAIDGGQELVCWGFDGDQRATPPAGLFFEVDAGESNTCALDLDGAIACWGNDSRGQSDPPVGTGYVDLAMGGLYGCALHGGGFVDCWGDTTRGRGAVPDADFVALDGGRNHVCGTTSDGKALCWGYYAY